MRGAEKFIDPPETTRDMLYLLRSMIGGYQPRHDQLFDLLNAFKAGSEQVNELQAKSLRLKRRVEELERALTEVMRYDHAPRLTGGYGTVDCACRVHEDARKLLSPQEKP